MWSFEHTETTRADPAQVWALYREPTRWPEWDHELAAVVADSPMILGAGGTLRPVRGPAVRFTVTELTEGVSFTDVARLPLARMTFAHHLAPTGSGTTLTHSVTITGPLSALFASLIGQQVAAELPAAMRSLARLAEGPRLSEQPSPTDSDRRGQARRR